MPPRWPWAPTPLPRPSAGEAARRGIAIKLVRNGSRGMVWLEPLVEVATPRGRIAYGPVAVGRRAQGLFAAGFLTGGDHALCLGPTDEIPWLARQQRRLRRVGVVDPRRWPTTSRTAAVRACAARAPWRRRIVAP
jgi:hypothetical protein